MPLLINPNIERWIKASIGKYFIDNKGIYPVFIEGQLREQAKAWTEIKIIALVPERYSANHINYTCTIIAFTNAVVDVEDQQLHYRIAGHFLSLFDAPIFVYKYGDGPLDDGKRIGCLVLRDDVTRPVDRLDYGNVENVQMTSLEGQYRMEQP